MTHEPETTRVVFNGQEDEPVKEVIIDKLVDDGILFHIGEL